jgi:hypothetical protein
MKMNGASGNLVATQLGTTTIAPLGQAPSS